MRNNNELEYNNKQYVCILGETIQIISLWVLIIVLRFTASLLICIYIVRKVVCLKKVGIPENNVLSPENRTETGTV